MELSGIGMTSIDRKVKHLKNISQARRQVISITQELSWHQMVFYRVMLWTKHLTYVNTQTPV